MRTPNVCDNCFRREGQLVHQKHLLMVGVDYIFRFYLCRYCRSAANRGRGAETKLVVVPFLEDAEVRNQERKDPAQ